MENPDLDDSPLMPGITVVSDDGPGGWYTVNASWLPKGQRVQGAVAAHNLAREMGEAMKEHLANSANAPIVMELGDKPEQVVAGTTGLQAISQGMGKRVKIILEESEEIPPTGLFIAHNGRGFVIVPGEEVNVPDYLVNVLDDAVVSVPVTDPQTKKVVGYRDRRRYNYRLVA